MRSTEFASAGYTAGQLNAIVKLLKKQAGEDGPNRFLRGEITVSEPTWREENGVIYFSVKSDGTTGEDWIKRPKDIDDRAKSVLRSPDFKSTNGVTTKVAVLKGMIFKNDDDRITNKICAYAENLVLSDGRRLTAPNAEIACLICEKFTSAEIEEMGLWRIVAMHEPINDSDGDLSLLSANCHGVGRWLDACHGRSSSRWRRGDGFAFAVSSRQGGSAQS